MNVPCSTSRQKDVEWRRSGLSYSDNNDSKSYGARVVLTQEVVPDRGHHGLRPGWTGRGLRAIESLTLSLVPFVVLTGCPNPPDVPRATTMTRPTTTRSEMTTRSRWSPTSTAASSTWQVRLRCRR
jgi:hypothetical protein